MNTTLLSAIPLRLIRNCLVAATVMSLLASGVTSSAAPHAIVEYVNLAVSSNAPEILTSRPVRPEPATNPPVVIEVNVVEPGQTMDGIGGAFNELGWDALTALPKSQRAEVLQALFDTKKGAALRFNRIPIGASDFAKSAYSLDDTEDDWELKDFSIQRDEGSLIPYIKAAQAVNPRMKFHASPWSPPGWMKTNGRQTGGGSLKDDDCTLKAYADYFVKFLQAYARHGIIVNRLCPQNEPLVAGSYPGCLISEPLYSKAVKNWIVPAVEKSGLKTEVWAGTFNFWRASTGDFFKDLLNDDGLAHAGGGISFQYSHIPWVEEYHKKYPQVPIQFSESQCFNGNDTGTEALRDFQDFAANVRAGCQLFTFWNMVLPEPRKSTWGWRQNSLVVIDKAKQTVTYEPDFALARLLGRHVVPGAHYLPATVATGDASIGALHYPAANGVSFMQTELEHGDQVVAFAKPDGSIVVFVVNQGPSVTAEIRFGGKRVFAMLPEKTLSAVVVAI